MTTERANTLGDLVRIAKEYGAPVDEVTIEFSDGMTMEAAHLAVQQMDGKTVYDLIVTDEDDEHNEKEDDTPPPVVFDETDATRAIVAKGGTVQAFGVDGEVHYEVELAGKQHGPMIETELFWFACGLGAM